MIVARDAGSIISPLVNTGQMILSMAVEDSFPTPSLAHERNSKQERILDILLRLPVRSLLRFKCVCKSWCSLISDPKFVKTHLSLAYMNPDYTHHRLLLLVSEGLKPFAFRSIDFNLSDAAVDLGCPFETDDMNFTGTIDFQGSCNGLVCLSVEICGRSTTFYIWNPSTRKSKKLPIVEGLKFTTCGFGYDESIDTYKVVAIRGNQELGGVFHSEGQVYTLGTDSWRRSEDYPHSFDGNLIGHFVSGRLHWTAWAGIAYLVVASFDLAKETFGEISLPYSTRNGYYAYAVELSVLRGYLCALCHYHDFTDVWMMTEYGIGESWSKFIGIRHDDAIPLCILKNEDVLFDQRGISPNRLVCYNLKDDTVSYPSGYPRFCDVCSYIESLVSPDYDADNGV